MSVQRSSALVPDEVLEILACDSDPFYFLDRHCQIFDATTGEWVPFRLWPGQVEALDDLRQHPLTIILKARQLGFSWLVLGYALWLMRFRPAATVLIFSKRDDEAVELLDVRLKEMHARLPSWLRMGAGAADGRHDWAVANGSRAKAFPTTGGRSYTGSLVIVDEADFVPDLNQLLNAVKPTIDAGGQLVLLSTADKGKPESTFKRIYRGARMGESPYRAVFHGWQARPERTLAWYEEQGRDVLARTGSLDDLHQEYPATDTEALSPRTLDKRLAPAWLEQCYQGQSPLSLLPAAAPAIPGLEVYVVPVPGRRYVIGGDPAEGNPTSDDSAATVLDAATGEECACLAGKYEPSTFAAHLAALSDWYHGAPALVERNNHGHAVLLWLRDNAPRVEVLHDLDGREGWQTTSKSKALLYDHAADAFRGREAVLHSFATFTQLASIEGSSLRAPEGQKDDRAVGCVLALQAVIVGAAPEMNIVQLKLTKPHEDPTMTQPIKFPQIRFFGQSGKFQPQPVIRGEKQIGAPDFPTQSEAAYFVIETHRQLGLTLPAFEVPDLLDRDGLEPDVREARAAKRAAVEKAVTAFIRTHRLEPEPKPEPAPARPHGKRGREGVE